MLALCHSSVLRSSGAFRSRGCEARPRDTLKGPGLAVYAGLVLAGAPGRPPPLHGREGHTGPSEQWHSQTTRDTPKRRQRANSPIPFLNTHSRALTLGDPLTFTGQPFGVNTGEV